MKEFAPYMFPLIAIMMVIFLFAKWLSTREDFDPNRKPDCSEYSERTINQMPARCIKYFNN